MQLLVGVGVGTSGRVRFRDGTLSKAPCRVALRECGAEAYGRTDSVPPYSTLSARLG